ncbi:hypothetical protein [Pantoea agglomerans]|uniref:hypothetical protein n=1 Tax=Enterobacter agglomerans TaxID=549 RepID=UPI002A6B0C35|nr:hypothetical protein [Pantoea agglomerans]MDY0900062.1 hypothetical protein [Pantoea agglomerans]
MARRITNNDKRKIIESINSWSLPDKITWERLCDSVTKKIGRRPTRQALYMHKDIVSAFEVKKGIIKSKLKCQVRPGNLQVAAERIERLEKKIEDSDKIIDAQREYINKLLLFCSRHNIRECDVTQRS